MNLAIETNDLGKRYGKVVAVEGLSLRVMEGEIYAFLGLNGAGKTTTIRMLLGMIRPTSGYACVLQTRVAMGGSPLITRSKTGAPAIQPWSSVGYLVETPHAYPELTVVENLEAARRMHPGTPPRAVPEIIDRLSLSEYADRRTGDLSLGNAQRLGLAKALLHDPKLLILDEPANGLDPAGIVEIRELLLSLTREKGVTVFMSSHILAEVSRLAQRIGIIHQGRLLQELNVDELERNRQRRLLLRVREPENARSALTAAGHPTDLLPGGRLELNGAAAIERPEEISTLLVRAGTPPVELALEEEDLEQYFLRLIGLNGGNHHA